LHPAKFLKIILVLCFSACKPSDEKPGNLISEHKMIEVMVDVHIFEAMKGEVKMSADSLARFTQINYELIFQKH